MVIFTMQLLSKKNVKNKNTLDILLQLETMIPVVDLAEYNLSVEEKTTDTATLKDLAGQICQAFQTVGFVYLKNHGIPKELVKRIKNVTYLIDLDTSSKKLRFFSASLLYLSISFISKLASSINETDIYVNHVDFACLSICLFIILIFIFRSGELFLHPKRFLTSRLRRKRNIP